MVMQQGGVEMTRHLGVKAALLSELPMELWNHNITFYWHSLFKTEHNTFGNTLFYATQQIHVGMVHLGIFTKI